MKKIVLGLIVAIALAVAIGIGVFRLQTVQEEKAKTEEVHAPRASSVDLNESQAKAVPALSESDQIAVFRVKSTSGTYSIEWKNAPATEGTGGAERTPLGVLHLKPTAGDIDVAVYVCEYGKPGSGNTALEINPKCPGGGHLVGPSSGEKPLGYLARSIRTGYLLLSRCSSAGGMYNTLNPRCENSADFWESNLGAIRAQKIL